MSDSLRLFVALTPPPEFTQQLVAATATLKHELSQWRWLSPNTFHLTLVFLGDTPSKTVLLLQKELDSAISDMAPQPLKFDELFTLPIGARPRVLATKPSNVPIELVRLHQQVNAAVSGFQLKVLLPQYQPKAYHFLPHITLARTQRAEPLTSRHVQQWSVHHLETTFFQLDLYQSHLLPQGAQYESLWQKKLR